MLSYKYLFYNYEGYRKKEGNKIKTIVILFILIALMLTGCSEKATQPAPELEEDKKVIEEAAEQSAEEISLGDLIEAEPLFVFLGKSEEEVLQHFTEDPLIYFVFEPAPGTTIINYDGFAFTCGGGGVVTSILRTEGDFLGITLGEDYDESQITEILGNPAAEGSDNGPGAEEQDRCITFLVEEYQLYFYLRDYLTVQVGRKGHFKGWCQ